MKMTFSCPQEIPELPGRSELIEELTEIANKYGIVPPQGSLRLRHEMRSQEIIYFNSSNDSLPTTSDLDTSTHSSQGLPTWDLAS